MLRILRNKAQSTLIQGLVLFIALVFIFWGVGSNMNGNRNSIAVVNGQEISIQEYQQAYDQAVERYRQQFNGQVPPGFFDKINLKKQVVGQLIQDALLRQGAAAMGLTVSKERIQREVEQMPVFQKDGHFDLERYKKILTRNRRTPKSFESSLYRDMLTKKVVRAIGSFAVLPENEVRKWLDFAGEELKLAVEEIKSSDFEQKVKVNDAELTAWFAQHKSEYTTEPKIRLQYLLFDADKDMKQVQVDEDKLKERYESSLDSYKIPEQRHVRHILFKVDKQADAAVVAAKKKEAEKVLALARAGKDFSALAKKYSQGPSAKIGGDLGFFPRGRMVKSFDDAVFSLKKGEISGLVRSPFGFHIIKLEEIRPAVTRSFADVKNELAGQVKKEEAKALAFKEASRAYEGIMRAGSLEKYSKQQGVKIVRTDFFSRSKLPGGVVSDPAFVKEAFSLGKGELSSLVELKNGYAILFVDDIKPPVVPSLADVRDRVIRDYRKEKAVVLAKKAADNLLAQAEKKGKLVGRDVRQTDYVKRGMPRVQGVPEEVVADAFSLSPKVVFPEHPVKVGTVFYIYRITDRRQDEHAIDKKTREQLRKQLLVNQQGRLLMDWLGTLQEKAKIWTNDTILK